MHFQNVFGIVKLNKIQYNSIDCQSDVSRSGNPLAKQQLVKMLFRTKFTPDYLGSTLTYCVLDDCVCVCVVCQYISVRGCIFLSCETQNTQLVFQKREPHHTVSNINGKNEISHCSHFYRFLAEAHI